MEKLRIIDDDFIECPECKGDCNRFGANLSTRMCNSCDPDNIKCDPEESACPECKGTGKISIDEYLTNLKSDIEHKWRLYDNLQKKYSQLTGKSYEWFK